MASELTKQLPSGVRSIFQPLLQVRHRVLRQGVQLAGIHLSHLPQPRISVLSRLAQALGPTNS